MKTHPSFRDAFEANSRRVDLQELAKTKRVGRVTSYATLERLLVDAVENILFDGAWDPALEKSEVQKRVSKELRKLLASCQAAAVPMGPESSVMKA